MAYDLAGTLSKILELIKDCEFHIREVEHSDLTIDEIRIIRNDDGVPIALQVVNRYAK